MCRYLLDREARLASCFGCLDSHGVGTQPTLFIDERIRSIIVAWLVALSHYIPFRPETLFVAISLLDRFLSRTKVRLTFFACMPIATLGAHAS